jgi:hypothetical protein
MAHTSLNSMLPDFGNPRELPRWLLAKGRKDDAKAVLVRYHANGNAEDDFVRLEYIEMASVITFETQTKTPWKALLSTPGIVAECPSSS